MTREEGRERLHRLLTKITGRGPRQAPDIEDLREYVRLAEELLKDDPEAFANTEPLITQVKDYIRTRETP